MHKFDILLGIDGRPLDGRLITLLRALQQHPSLAAAARETGISYRHAWGELARIADALGGPVVELQRGRGAALTPAGNALLALHATLDAALAAGYPALIKALRQSATAAPLPSALRIRASHDFALPALRDLAAAEGIAVELNFEGSLDALNALAGGDCDLAGFHVAIAPPAAAGLGPLARVLRGRSLRLIEVAIRRQGLMLAADMAARVRGLGDLARGDVRFINRQPGSGTRLLFDRLLANEGIAAEKIRGYHEEEFTHAAVAATIASGQADAGFGIQAAAHAQGLKFIWLAIERYFLAARAATLARPAVRAFCQVLDSPAFEQVLSRLPGYAAPTSREPKHVAEAFEETPLSFR